MTDSFCNLLAESTKNAWLMFFFILQFWSQRNDLHLRREHARVHESERTQTNVELYNLEELQDGTG